MSTITIDLNFCGTNSIIGCVYEKVIALRLVPEAIIVNIDTVMRGTEVDKELEKAQRIYVHRGFSIELGTVRVDLYKEEIARNSGPTQCYS